MEKTLWSLSIMVILQGHNAATQCHKETKKTTGIRSWYLYVPKLLSTLRRTEWLLEQSISKDFNSVLDMADIFESAVVTASMSNSES